MENEPDDITRLLRLKRFEQPPPGYYEDFLRKFKDRQRAQLLREPAWRIAWDRVCAFFQVPARIGYGLASTAVLLVAGIMSMNILQTHPDVAVRTPRRVPVAQTAPFDLSATQFHLPAMPEQTGATAAVFPPRYVMDTRPVSYVPPSNF